MKNGLSDNVGGVKHFSRTLQRALGEERHFALVDGFAFSNPGSLVISQVGNSVRPMHLFGRQLPIMITTSNSSVKRSGTPINMLDVLLHTMAISELSRVRTEFDPLLVIPSLTHHPVQVHPVFAPARLWPVPFSAASHTVLIGFSGSYPPTCCTPNPRSTPIAHRVRRKHQRLPPSLLIENASDRDSAPPQNCARGVSDQGA